MNNEYSSESLLTTVFETKMYQFAFIFMQTTFTDKSLSVHTFLNCSINQTKEQFFQIIIL